MKPGIVNGYNILEEVVSMDHDCCINCGEVLSVIERNRSECLDCRDRTSPTHSDDLTEE
ncbi:hypothetical protein P9E76_04090 [Schinkia azotoformans]|uniref:hypothetical protein n=1 Tax=Schinkia azotoformans TaxID=1454 RepID=UPI002DBE03AF|nr:hypothetical protein [Schinkia azotoformans]MEC1721414.1 hypothetical protein [Schinkia azotoformans]MEC1944231.1 hypothetical protein [Schinkia azotoformans]MED4352562.1 hypothetical protein [Schinkia azotoformans]MED4414672.1 hypothetical protein [Schinkia azotoformans]